MSFWKNIKLTKGFTLLELLIVIVIIGVLAIIIIPNLISGPARARDSQRKADLRSIKTALESYYNDQNSYPTTLEVLTQGAAPYIKTLPTDPKTKAAYIYIPAGNPPNSYVLKATLENSSDKDIKSGTTNVYEVSSTN
ncbi:type II secretion system protein GspG [Candidatus Saccharibacteria bacterium]|nr:type II secretion system protein GspG [Candidatus Saccharibacteria bacterium]